MNRRLALASEYLQPDRQDTSNRWEHSRHHKRIKVSLLAPNFELPMVLWNMKSTTIDRLRPSSFQSLANEAHVQQGSVRAGIVKP